MQPIEQLSQRAGEALLAVERSSDIKVDWLVELLGLTEDRRDRDESTPEFGMAPMTREDTLSLGRYGYVKRACDIFGTISLCILLAPLVLILGVLVALDVGFPLVFWQKRPGRSGRPFKLFKFCTMHPAHDLQGNRIPDEQRSSIVGTLLRRTKLDELPQLYNILVGEMSFVGPRPLLPVDQPVDRSGRLVVRPGLTGLAQVYGGREISPEDKNALDILYIRNASLWLDVKILLRTAIIMVTGDQVDQSILRAARAGVERLTMQDTASSVSYSLIPKGVVRDGEVGIAHPGN
jgi:lipopolysaccharide/colanic/teichoic acid biosynthesis glycosyltransferase